MKLYDNGFSPFARKVRIVLDYKGLEVELVDGLRKDQHHALAAVNARVEVPTLVDGTVTVVNSSDIVSYLDQVHPQNPIYPRDPAARVKARAWERCADSYVDAIFVDISYWTWANRPDVMPPGLLEAAKADMKKVYDAIERDLGEQDYLGGSEPNIADFALFPHLTAGKVLGVPFSKEEHKRVSAWLRRSSVSTWGRADLTRTRNYLESNQREALEVDKIFWRGDRIEWMLARGFHGWFVNEIEAGRVMWPGPAIPGA